MHLLLVVNSGIVILQLKRIGWEQLPVLLLTTKIEIYRTMVEQLRWELVFPDLSVSREVEIQLYVMVVEEVEDILLDI